MQPPKYDRSHTRNAAGGNAVRQQEDIPPYAIAYHGYANHDVISYFGDQ